MTAALVVLNAMAAILVVGLTVSSAAMVRRGNAAYGLLVMLWGSTLVASDLVYAAVVGGHLDAEDGRRWALALVVVFALAQLALTRLLFSHWVELNLDAYMVGV